MKLTNIEQVSDFLNAVERSRGEVWLESQLGDRFNLKSPLSRYIAIGALLTEKGNELELFCSDNKDKDNFFDFFEKNPEVV